MANSNSVEARLERVEASLERLVDLLQSGAAGRFNGLNDDLSDSSHWSDSRRALASGVTDGMAALGEAYGEAAMREHIADVVIRLGEPETLASITRIATLAPQLEYALHGVAAGPTLLEEGIELARAKMARGGTAAVDLQQHINGATEVLTALSQIETSRALARIARCGPSLAPLVETGARVAEAFAREEGLEGLEERVAEVLLTIAERDTLDALARIIALAPNLEYAAQAAAAGPVLLEEGLELIRTKLVEVGMGPDEAKRRAEVALDAVVRLSRPATLEALSEVAGRVPSLIPLIEAATQAFDQIGAVEGTASLRERLMETVLRLADMETLDALTRVGSLVPQIEYAVNALAAAPTLLEEGLAFAREQLVRREGDTSLDGRLRAAADVLVVMSRPAVLQAIGEMAPLVPRLKPLAIGASRALTMLLDAQGEQALTERVTEMLVTIANPETMDTLTRIGGLLPQLEYAMYFVAAGPALFEEAMETLRRVAGVDATPGLLPLLETMGTLAKSLDFDAITRIVQSIDWPTAARLIETIDWTKLSSMVDSVDVAALERLVSSPAAWATVAEFQQLIEDETTRAALLGLMRLAPQLERPLRALPVESATLDILKTLNRAVEQSTEHAQKVGAWGAFAALRDPHVQRSLGFLLKVASQLGHHLEDSKPALTPVDAAKN